MTKARTNADNASADIQGVTAGTGLSGGGTSGTVTLTNDMATTIDAKGDLVVGTGADTYSRLATGNAGETLVADSSTSTGLRWQVPKTQNAVYNSSFDIWQRGTSFTGLSPYYTADRWIGARAGAAAGGTWTRQSSGLTGFTYSARMQRDSGNTATTEMRFGQSLETADSVRFAGKTVTFSLYAKAGANYSGGSGGAYVVIYTGTGTDQQYWVSGFTGGAVLGIAYFTPTTSWQRFSVTATVGSSANEIAFGVAYGPSGTAGANDWLEVTGVQFEEGSVATPYTRQNATLAGELAACQRYYSKSYMQTDAPATVTSAGAISGKVSSNTVANSEQYGSVFLPVAMRTNPTVTIYSYNGATSKVSDPASGTDFAANSGNASWIGQNSFMVINNSGGTLATTRFSVLLHYVASAEL
jgi:hypothetical protein